MLQPLPSVLIVYAAASAASLPPTATNLPEKRRLRRKVRQALLSHAN